MVTPYRCILVSLDGTRGSEAILTEVEKLLQTCPATVILLRVGPQVDLDAAAHEMEPGVEHASDLPDEEYELLANATEIDIREYLEAIGERLRRTGSQVITEVSFSKQADEILFFARHYKADLIAMTTHARTGLDRWLHGSVAETVLHQALCPVLLMRRPDVPLPRFGSAMPEEVRR